MYPYIIRRLLPIPILLFGMTVLLFGMISLLPVDVRLALCVRNPNGRGPVFLIKQCGLNDSISVQYVRWLFGRENTNPYTGEVSVRGGILRGDFGWSRIGSDTVANVFIQRFPATVELALWAIVPIVGIGVWMGVLAVVKHNKWQDQLLWVFAIVGQSLPSFVVGLILLMFLYARLQWFPPGRLSDWANAIVTSNTFVRHTGMNTIDAILNGRPDIFFDALRHLVLPVLTLAYIQWALLLKITRSSILESLRQGYVNAARAKGLAEKVVINRHVRPNALIPIVTGSGATVVGLLNGVIITETIYNYPGIGSVAAQAAASLDVLTVLGFTLFTGIVLLASNLVVDILHAAIDPRVRLS